MFTWTTVGPAVVSLVGVMRVGPGSQLAGTQLGTEPMHALMAEIERKVDDAVAQAFSEPAERDAATRPNRAASPPPTSTPMVAPPPVAPVATPTPLPPPATSRSKESFRDLLLSLPVYPGAAPEDVAVIFQGDAWSAYLTPDPRADITAFFETALVANGWQIVRPAWFCRGA